MAKSIISNNPAQLVTKARANLTDWTSYTPTFEGLGTESNVEAHYRRVGDKVEIRGFVTSGTPTASPLTISLPNSINIDSNKVITTDFRSDLGIWSRVNGGQSFDAGAGYQGIVFPDTATSTTKVFISIRAASDTAFQKTNANVFLSAGDSLSFHFTAPIAEWSGSDVTFLAPQPTQRVAYIKDVKASGTQGGTATAGSYFTRTLNTLEGDTEFVSLSSNQFTLEAGKYEIEAESTGYRVSIHRIKLRNITDSTDDIIGSNAYSDNGGISIDNSRIRGTIEIGASKTYEIQHQVGNTVSTNGLGVACSFGDDEVYTQVKITKLK